MRRKAIEATTETTGITGVRHGTAHRRGRRLRAAMAMAATIIAVPAATVDAAGQGWIPMDGGLYDTQADSPGYGWASVVVDGLTYVGGAFDEAGGVTVNNIAVWDGSSFQALGDPETDGPSDWVWSLATDGDLLYAGGPFGVMSWDPSSQTWTDLGAPANAEAYALLWYSDGVDSYLVMGGVDGSASDNCALHRYDSGLDTWSSIADVTSTVVQPCGIYALAQFGNEMVVGGQFEDIDGSGYDSLALWTGDGNVWSELPQGGVQDGGEVGAVAAIAVDDANDTLYLGGYFDDAGGTSVMHLAAWDAANGFTELGDTTNLFDPLEDEVDALRLDGDQLMVGGWFAIDGASSNVATLDLTTQEWSPLLGGVDDVVDTITFNESLQQLYVGGEFTTALDEDGITPVDGTGGIAMFGATGVAPQITSITITGTARVGQTLTANVATTGDPTPTVELQWIRCTTPVALTAPTVERAPQVEAFMPNGCVAISGATATTYRLVAADQGKYIGVIANVTNGIGFALGLEVRATAVAAAPTPAPTTSPSTTAPAFELPATGGHDTSLAWVALALLASGTVLLVLRRRTA